jgi:hypothetical protein
MVTSVRANVLAVRRRIAVACERAGRDPAGVLLIGASSASKGVSDAQVVAAIDAGLHDFGENYTQEADARIAALGPRAREARWHFIGHLQTNKVPAALRLFDTIHSVDSVRLAEHLSRRSQTPLRVLLEVNVAAETSKFGFSPAEVAEAVSKIAALPNLELRGLMTVAPAVREAEEVRPVFVALRQLACANGLQELSMGMTDDFEVAIEEGATMVRVGRALFQERPA